MNLNNRRFAILTALLNEEGGIPLNELVKRFRVTKRMLTYDFEEINAWLRFGKMGTVRISKGVATLQSSRREELRWIGNSNQGCRFSIEERRIMEYLHLVLSSSPMTAETLSVLFDVSINTIFLDMKMLRLMLQEKGLVLANTGRGGYIVQGEEGNIRRLIGESYHSFSTEYPRKTLYLLVQESLECLLGEDLDFFVLVFSAIRHFEQQMNTKLLTVDINYLISMLLIVQVRNLKGFFLVMPSQEQEVLAQTQEYQAVQVVMEELQKSGFSLGKNELSYVTSLFLGAKNFDTTLPEMGDSYIKKFTRALVFHFERVACVRFTNEEYLKNRLYLHIRPMYYRLKYGVPVENKLLPQIRETYLDNFFYTKRALQLTGGMIAQLMTDEEAAFLCAYMASALNTAPASPPQRRLKILIVCNSGVASAVLMREQLAELIGKVFSCEIVPPYGISEQQYREYDLVISTVPLDAPNCPVVFTGPILSKSDQHKLLSAISRTDPFLAHGPQIEEMMETVRRHATIHDEEALFADLVRIQLNGRSIPSQGDYPTLREALREKETVEILEPVTLDQALKRAAQGLTRDEEDCTQAAFQMNEHIQQGASLYEMVPKVALEHFQSLSGRPGLRILVFQQDQLQYGGQGVRVLVVISCLGNNAHYPLLGQLYHFFRQPTVLPELMACANEEEMVRYIVGFLEENVPKQEGP